MCLAWKILKTLGRDVDKKSTPPKIVFRLWFKLRALAPLQIPASLREGPIYLLLCYLLYVILPLLLSLTFLH